MEEIHARQISCFYFPMCVRFFPRKFKGRRQDFLLIILSGKGLAAPHTRKLNSKSRAGFELIRIFRQEKANKRNKIVRF